jgi:hypothetical protein
MAVSPLAPDPEFEERAGTQYGTGHANNSARRGPLRFQEGISSDSDVTYNFSLGVRQGHDSHPGRPNVNAPVWQNSAEETLRERAHVGSASWPEAPSLTSEFAGGSGNDGETSFAMVKRDGHHQARRNYAEVQ